MRDQIDYDVKWIITAQMSKQLILQQKIINKII